MTTADLSKPTGFPTLGELMDRRADFDGRGLSTPGADLLALQELVRQARRPGEVLTACLEVGTWAGRTALAMADAGAKVWCVDTWLGSASPLDDTNRLIREQGGPEELYAAFRRNVAAAGYEGVITPCRGDSLAWAAARAAAVHPALDLVFLDGDHRYESVCADIEAWRPHVRPGGILCGHDFGTYPGVTRAVTRLVKGYRKAGSCLWWVRIGGG